VKSEKHSEKNVKLIVELRQSLRKELKSRAALEGLNMKEIVTKLIEDYVEKKSKKS
jgi:hypothetical protein